jgi:hypothetical protein
VIWREAVPLDRFNVFRLAARTHGSFADTLELLAALFAPVILALHPFIELDIDRSANCTHLTSPQKDCEGGI